jgi:hypothetical protein
LKLKLLIDFHEGFFCPFSLPLISVDALSIL